VDSKGNPVGVLKLENKLGEGAGKRFSPFEEAMHKTFASHIGIAIERARLYERLDEEARRRARESLGDDLHDTMNVLHGGVVLKTAYLKELAMQGEDHEVLRGLDKMAKAARNVYDGLRRIHQDVREPILQEQGLIPALKHYANMLAIRTTFNLTGREHLPPNVEYALYKIGQEALSNVAKHARLGENDIVEVRLEKTAKAFMLSISDPGLGFDTETVLNKSDAFGLQSMDRWARSIDAQLKVASQPGKGTRVCVNGRIKELKGER